MKSNKKDLLTNSNISNKKKSNINLLDSDPNKFESEKNVFFHLKEQLEIAKKDDILDSVKVPKIINEVKDITTEVNLEEKNKAKYNGLSSQEAEIALKKFGFNKLAEKKKKSTFFIFLKQLKDIMILLLFIAMIASFAVFIVIGIQLSWDFSDTHLIISFVEPFIILAVIVMYDILGGIQELKSQQAVSALKKLSVPYATVIRDNKVTKIESIKVVPGDLMIIEAGDQICADAQVLEANNLVCIEAALTGESLPITKDPDAIIKESAAIGDQLNKVFSGCIVNNGWAKCKVLSTGTKTQIGQIANLIDNQKIFMTPLQLKLNKLGHIFGYAGIALFILVFLIQIFILGINNIGTTWQTALTTSISLAVAAIPEGLGAFTTIILSIGIKKMARYNALIKKVSSVETLGSTSVICTDKTGTLTLNKMTLTDMWYPGAKPLENLEQELNLEYRKMVEYFLMCSNSYLDYKDNKLVEIGDPTELAIVNYAKQKNIDKAEIDKINQRIYSIPFDSERKLMSSVNFIDNKWICIVKGAPDVLVSKCLNANWEDIRPQIEFWSKKAYRVLAIATKQVTAPNSDYSEHYLEDKLEFLGLFAMYDPPRPETAEAIKECIGAGIKTVMITGDHLDTAKAIASQIGIYKTGDQALSGKDLNELTDSELEANIANYSVYARVSPADKLRIVKAWQANDQVVAMTGDGVNDAPALKAADIGCAMGITGTDVSKEAADMILMDDNFTTIVNSVSNGRQVYQTIKRVIQNVLLSSVAEIIVMFLGIIIFRYAFDSSLLEFDNNLNTSSPTTDLHIFGASQLLLINLFTDGFPAIALGIQGSNENLMKRRPYSKHESIFARRMGFNLFWQGILFGLVSLVAFSIGALYSRDHWFGNTMNGLDSNGNLIPGQIGLYQMGLNDLYAGSAAAFITLGIGVSVHALSLMSNKSIFRCSLKEFWIVYGAVLISIIVVIFASFIPQVALVFRMPPNLLENGFLIGIGLVFAIAPLIVMEFYKLLYSKIQNEVLNTVSITTFEIIQKPSRTKIRK